MYMGSTALPLFHKHVPELKQPTAGMINGGSHAGLCSHMPNAPLQLRPDNSHVGGDVVKRDVLLHGEQMYPRGIFGGCDGQYELRLLSVVQA